MLPSYPILMDSLRLTGNLEILKEKALLLRDESLVAIADLHLGYESALELEGISIPRRQKAAMLESLSRIIDDHGPETMVVNGDFKHNFSRNLDEEWLEVKEVLRFLKDRTRLVVVRGNHDNYLASILSDMGIDLRKSYRAGGHTFVHGHWDIKTKGPIVMGHEHPALKLRDEVGAIVTLPAFAVDRDLIVLPAFSPLALGMDVSSQPYLSPILNARDINDARVLVADDKEGILDFGTIADLKSRNAALILK
jgi:putative SbcD/Mre11-related phosphoesterase